MKALAWFAFAFVCAIEGELIVEVLLALPSNPTAARCYGALAGGALALLPLCIPRS